MERGPVGPDALDPANGAVVWKRHVGTPVPRSDPPCGDIDPLGITSTMAYESGSRLVLALAESIGERTPSTASTSPPGRSG